MGTAALRVRLQMGGRVRELALFNLGVDSKLRGCDLVGLEVRDVCHGDLVAARAIVVQHKTQRPVQFVSRRASSGERALRRVTPRRLSGSVGTGAEEDREPQRGNGERRRR